MSRRQPLLFLAQRIPYPPNKGDKLRSFAILRHLSSLWDIHLGCFVDDSSDWQHVAAVKSYCADICCVGMNRRWAKLRSLGGLAAGTSLSEPYFYDSKLGRWVDVVLNIVQPPAAFLYSSVMGQYVLTSAGRRPPRVILDFVDVDSDKWRQYASAQTCPMSWLYARESRRLLAFERAMAIRADASIFVSAAEAALFRRLAPETADKVHAISNGIDFDYYSPDGSLPDPFPFGSRRILFTGTMDYWPNIDAVTWFVEAMLPAIQTRFPEAVFYVVGSNPTPVVTRLGDRQGVVVTGRVPDIRPYLTHAEVVVAPLRVARGIQNKVLEGMAMAKVVITTDHGLEGLDAVPGRDLLVANTPPTFIDAAIGVLTGPASGLIGAAARQRIVAAYGWNDKLTACQRLLVSPDVSGLADLAYDLRA